MSLHYTDCLDGEKVRTKARELLEREAEALKVIMTLLHAARKQSGRIYNKNVAQALKDALPGYVVLCRERGENLSVEIYGRQYENGGSRLTYNNSAYTNLPLKVPPGKVRACLDVNDETVLLIQSERTRHYHRLLSLVGNGHMEKLVGRYNGALKTLKEIEESLEAADVPYDLRCVFDLQDRDYSRKGDVYQARTKV